jgi:hypothetical protein
MLLGNRCDESLQIRGVLSCGSSANVHAVYAGVALTRFAAINMMLAAYDRRGTRSTITGKKCR